MPGIVALIEEMSDTPFFKITSSIQNSRKLRLEHNIMAQAYFFLTWSMLRVCENTGACVYGATIHVTQGITQLKYFFLFPTNESTSLFLS